MPDKLDLDPGIHFEQRGILAVGNDGTAILFELSPDQLRQVAAKCQRLAAATEQGRPLKGETIEVQLDA